MNIRATITTTTTSTISISLCKIGVLVVNNGWLSDGADVLYNKFNVSGSSPPDNPAQHPNSAYSCVVATADHWKVSRSDELHMAVCQSDHNTLPGMTN